MSSKLTIDLHRCRMDVPMQSVPEGGREEGGQGGSEGGGGTCFVDASLWSPVPSLSAVAFPPLLFSAAKNLTFFIPSCSHFT
jgi:hypothetical protein